MAKKKEEKAKKDKKKAKKKEKKGKKEIEVVSSGHKLQGQSGQFGCIALFLR